MSHDLKSHLAELMRAALRSVAPSESDAVIHIERPKQDHAWGFFLQSGDATGAIDQTQSAATGATAGLGVAVFAPGRPERSRWRRFHQLSPVAGGQARSAAQHSRTGRRVRSLDHWRQAPRAGRVRFGQSDRTAARRARPWCRLWRQPVQAARLCRLGRDQRILRQRRWPSDGYPCPVDLAALPGTKQTGQRAISAKRLPGRIRSRHGQAVAAAHPGRYLRPLASISEDLPGLPDPERTDAAAGQQREDPARCADCQGQAVARRGVENPARLRSHRATCRLPEGSRGIRCAFRRVVFRTVAV
jgi:hypothetical protein